jgi:hypothetical protein
MSDMQIVKFPEASDQIVKLPDSRTYRVLSRAGAILAAIGLQARDALGPFLAVDPYSVGIYCAMENCQNDASDYMCAKHARDATLDKQAAIFKTVLSTKHVLKQAASIPSSQLAIYLGIMGPQNVFTHSKWGCLHALEQAEFELETGAVRAALVCSAFSAEDPMMNSRIRRSRNRNAALREAGAALVLEKNDLRTDWAAKCGKSADFVYGTAQDLVLLAEDAAIQKASSSEGRSEKLADAASYKN